MELDAEAVKREQAEIIARYGKWTAHNIHLVDDAYTIQNGLTGDEFRLRRVMQIIDDMVGSRRLQDMRVLDLACLEGMYSVELARRGATVVAIEGREANIAKAAFAKRVLRLDKLELIQDDVRNLSREQHGQFDIVLCLGILYHLDSPEIFTFMERLAEVCTGFVIIATHTSVTRLEVQTYQGHEYWGSWTQEHAPDSTPEERRQALWASLDNRRSFVLTKASLYNSLVRVGFTTAFQCRIPPETIYEYPAATNGRHDWSTFLAIAGNRSKLASAPLMNERPWENLPDGPHENEACRNSAAAPQAGRTRSLEAVTTRIRRLLRRR
jgi:2-polyprenyl-3-methyl-5-hydroxy-6-metoxy-1,4-benzoquinol methylase